MSNARNLANLLESDGDIKVAALDNAPAPTKSTIDALGIAATSLTGSQATAITNNATAAAAARAGRKNLILNGSMQVAQRGTNSSGNGYVSLDRWYVNQSGGSTTFSQETNTSPSETGGIKSYARLNVSSSSNYTGINQKIEDVTSVPSGIVTLSFWAKGTVPVGGLYLNCAQDFGTGGSSDVDLAGILITSSLTSSWVKYSTQITIPSVDGKTINAGSFFVFQINQGGNSSSTAYDLNITGVQLELGSGTDFEHRSYGEILADCQRYFQRVASGADAGTTSLGIAAMYNVNQLHVVIPLSVTMRVKPTVTISSGTDYYVFYRIGAADTFNGWTCDTGSSAANRIELYVNANIAGTAGHTGMARCQNSSALVTADAEL